MKPISKRRGQRRDKEKHDKNLLSLERELNRLYRLKWTSPMVPLPEPIRSGWKRFLVLRSDIANRSDAAVIRQILRKINVTHYSKRDDFMAWSYKLKAFVPIGKEIKPIGLGEWDNIVKNEKWNEQHRAFFAKGTGCQRSGGWFRTFEGYWFINDYMFEYKVEPHFITELPEYNPALETKIAQLQKQLWSNWKNTGRLNKLHGYRGWRHDDWYQRTYEQIADDIMTLALKELQEHE
jgi:hypothetical protein